MLILILAFFNTENDESVENEEYFQINEIQIYKREKSSLLHNLINVYLFGCCR